MLIRSNTVCLNPTALRKTKIICNFGLSKCSRVELLNDDFVHFVFVDSSVYGWLSP